MKVKRRRRSYREQLAIARAQLRAINKILTTVATSPPAEYGPTAHIERPIPGDEGAILASKLEDAIRELPKEPKFIKGWAASRAGFVVTQVLDESGQVWERRVKLGPEVAKGEERELVDQWWEKVGMERR